MTITNNLQPSQDNRVPLTGYSDQLSVRPGDNLAFKLSATGFLPSKPARVKTWLTQSICADPNPAGPGIIERDASAWYAGADVEVVEQAIHAGSYAQSEEIALPEAISDLELCTTIWPTLCNGTEQCIMHFGAIEIYIAADNSVRCRAGEVETTVSIALSERQWSRCSAALIQSNHDVHLSLTVNTAPTLTGVDELPPEATSIVIASTLLNDLFNPREKLYLAARQNDSNMINHFNGKLEAPALIANARSSEKLANKFCWDFSKQMSSCRISDSQGHGTALTLVNMPTRAMKCSHWTGEEMCWRHKPEHYAAIHFHNDDLVDAGWQTTFSFNLPDSMPSGVYVMRISDGTNEDAMPFFVCAPKGQASKKLCVLVSTFTYAIYGNHARPDWAPQWQEKNEQFNAYPYNPAQYPGYGLSTYNYHSDGSGICHASHLRPLFNLRPGYITFGNTSCSGLRHFQADSHLLAWLDAMDIGFDVITDRELHNEGEACIDSYDVLLTGSHPEYHTSETLNALTNFRDGGGHLSYLGGNGFYWRIALHAENEDTLEIRRAEAGIRAWAAEPGEYYQAFDGHYGGLWRRNGRPPQALCGLGFSAQGEFHGSYYKRCNVDNAPAWIFDGIESDIIGDFGLCGGGAAGFELDRADLRLGTPQNAVVIASSEAHGEDFILVPEEMLTHLTTLPGPPADELTRADMIWFETAGGGSVFSVGSITFCGSLPHNNFVNSVSRLLRNVVRHCLAKNQS